MRLYLLIVATAACRYGFDDRNIATDSNVIGPDSIGNGSAQTLGPCEQPAPTAPVALSGSTYTFTSFNSTANDPGVTIAVVDRASSAMLAMTTSDSNGAYSLSLAPTGQQLDVIIAAADTSHLTTVNYPTLGLTDPATVDSPLWDTGAIGAIYNAAGVAENAAASMLNIGVFHCTGAGFEGATVDVSPAPDSLQYIDGNGVPSSTQGMTLGTYTYALALNAVAGPTTITVSAAGATFLPQQIQVLGGPYTTRVMMYGE